MKNNLVYLAAGLITLSCGGETDSIVDNTTNDPKNNIELINDSLLPEKAIKLENIIYAVPSPSETIKILEDAGAVFDIQLTNDPMNKDNYTSKTQKALNLGVYGADVNYCSAFNKTTEILLLSACAEGLATDLGLSSVFSKDVYDRLIDNLDIKDSVQKIVSHTYWEMESYLEQDDRPELSALIIIGGWIEGINTACGQAKINDKNETMKQRIAEQGYALESVIGLAKMTDQQNPDINDLIEKLEDLQVSFNKIESTKTPGENTTDAEGVLSIGGKITYNITPEILEEITVKVFRIRDDIIE